MKYQTQRREIKKSLGTPQGRHTLQALLICTILGMTLNWVIPIIILKVTPDFPPTLAQEIGMFVALGIASLFLVVSLLKGQISKRQQHLQQRSGTQNSGAQLFDKQPPPQRGK